MQDQKGNVAYVDGDFKEAIERTREAEAYRREHYVRKFNGDKLAADKFLASGRRMKPRG